MEGGTNLVWIDLEMTGLNPEQDVILEIASIVTDNNLNIIEEGPSLIIHQPENKLATMSEWSQDMHTKSGLIEKVRSSSITLEQAYEQTFTFIKNHCQSQQALLCGNSVWQDRAFLRRYMPEIIEFLYYRLIDVTTVKELVLRWYPDDEHAEFVKKDTHRALTDIRESIAELRHYRKYFFV